MNKTIAYLLFIVALFSCNTSPALALAKSAAKSKKIVLVAGPKSHGYGAHEHKAGCLLLEKCLNETLPTVETQVYSEGWPEDPDFLEDVDALVIYCDGGKRHVVNKHLKQVEKHVARGMGVSCLHYAVESPKEMGGNHLKEWIGGFFDINWSVNPHWEADFTTFPKHPIARGVKPFSMLDEWYFNMRFIDGAKGVTPILTAVPPASAFKRPDGPHSNNPHVRKMQGQGQHVGWCVEREDGGRGFGFTGGHYHWNWKNDNFRKVALNAIAWTAHIEIPQEGFTSKTPDLKDMENNQDYSKPENWKPHAN